MKRRACDEEPRCLCFGTSCIFVVDSTGYRGRSLSTLNDNIDEDSAVR